MNVKICAGPQGGGSARGGVRYVLGYSLGSGEKDDRLAPEERRELFHKLMRESMERANGGVGETWRPEIGEGVRPSAVYAEGVTSLATADIEMDVTARVAKAHLVKDKVVHVVVSFNESESRWITDEQAVQAALEVFGHSSVGLADHQKVLAVHRDTLVYDRAGELIDGNVHVHAMINAIHPETLRPWVRQGDYARMHYAARDTEIHSQELIGAQLEHDRGVYVVRTFEGEKRIERATDAERDAWTHERMEQRLQERVMRTLGDYQEYETAHSWAAAEVETPIREYLEKVNAHNEIPRWVDLHLIAARAGGSLERGEREGQLQVRWLERASDRVELDDSEQRALSELSREHRGWRKVHVEHGDWLYRKQYDALRGEMTVRGDELRERPSLVVDADTPVIPLDLGSLVGPKPERVEDYDAWQQRLGWLSEYRSPAEGEQDFARALRRDPGLVSRELVAGGDAMFTRQDIDEFIGHRISDPDVLSGLSQLVEERDGSLRMLGVDAELPIFTTAGQLSLEERVDAKWRPLIRERDPLFDPAALEQAIDEVEQRKEIRLSDEQRHVLDGLERRSSWTQGYAGTGKTSIQEVTARYCELTARESIGLATSARAAQKLGAESGAQAMNLTLALVNEEIAGRKVIPEDAIIMLDEASMVDMRHFDKLLTIVHERRATIIGIGDRAQLPPIGAGDTLRKAEELHDVPEGYFSTLTEVRRQRGEIEWMRPVVADLGRAIIEDDAAGIRRNIETMAAREVFEFHESRRATFAAAAEEYVARCVAGEEVIVCVQDHRDARHLNREIRERLDLGPGNAFKTSDGVNTQVAPGERIRFSKNDRHIGVLNGNAATVTDVYYNKMQHKWQIEATLDVDGKKITWNPREYTHFRHGYAGTAHAAQAQSVESNIFVITRPAEARLANVGWTRGERAIRVHVSREAFATPADLAAGIAQRNPVKLDALLYREYEQKFGGPNSYWAINVRRAMADDRHPLKREWRKEMRALQSRRGDQLIAIRDRYQSLVKVAGDESADRKRLEFAYRHDVQTVTERMAEKSFVSWAADQRCASRIERDGLQLVQSAKAREYEQRLKEHRRNGVTREEQLQRQVERAIVDREVETRERAKARDQEHTRER